MANLTFTIFNYIIYFVQAVAFVVFSLKILAPKFKPKTTMIISVVPVLLLFSAIAVLNSLQVTMGYIGIISFLLIMWLYTLIFFENSLFLRIFVPVFSYILYTTVVFFYYFIATILLKVDWYNLLQNGKTYSMVATIIINLTFVFAMYIVYKYCKGHIHLNSISEYIFFVILPLIVFGILFLSFLIATDRKTSQPVIISLGVISCATVFMSTVVMSFMLRAAHSNRIQTENYIMKKQQELYREKIIEANKNLEEIAVIRHDMKNKILCIGELLNSSNYDEAKLMCSDLKYELEKSTVLFHTDNLYLNSILNITYKKAKDRNIDIKITAACNFKGIGSSDLVAMIGNLCDNAIEYLSTVDGERNLELKLSQKGNYYFISGKNNITASVLSGNPKLKSGKDDKVLHGHGIKNIKNIAKKYKGSVDIHEDNGYFIVNIMLEIPHNE